MSENENLNRQQIVTDYLLGKLDPDTHRKVSDRIENEPELKRLRDDLANTFAALKLAPEHEPPSDLAARTMARIQTAKQTDALLAREQLARRDVIRPTFSMREIAAAASIVLIVGVIFGVSFREVNRRAMITQCRTNAMRIGAGLTGFANRHDGMLPAVDAPGDRWLPADDQPAASNSSALFRLVRDQSVEAPAFQCPAVGGGSFTVRPEMTDFPSAEYVNYSYQHSVGQKGLSIFGLEGVKDSMAILADSSPVFDNGRFRADCLGRSAGDNHNGAGQTVLYMDMHADFKDKPSVGVNGNNIYLADGITDYKGDEKPTGPTDTFLLPAWSPAKPAGR